MFSRLMVKEPFSKVTLWIEETTSFPYRTRYFEHLYVVCYHLSRAVTQVDETRSASSHYKWTISSNRKLIIVTFQPELIIYGGDTAIREAASALDATLGLINGVLNLQVRQRDIKWSRPSNGRRNCPLYDALNRLGDVGQPLVELLDRIYGSYQYRLLADYRNWVTHRGAPSLVLPEDFGTSWLIPMPEEYLTIEDTKDFEWQIDNHVYSTLGDALTICSYPFVPPVQQVLSGIYDATNQAVDIPGTLRVGEGFGEITIKHSHIRQVDWLSTPTEYTTSNPIPVDLGRKPFAGEELALYRISDYVHAVDEAVDLVWDALHGSMNELLLNLCMQHYGTVP